MRLADPECQSKSDQGIGAADFQASERVRVHREAVIYSNVRGYIRIRDIGDGSSGKSNNEFHLTP
jgi:hypothetical protein